MHRITHVLPGTASDGDRLHLDYDRRNRRRIVLETVGGERVLLDMPRAVHLRGGDAVRLDDGRLLAVDAADEALAEIVADDAAGLVRIAWHLGNRHLPTQLLPGPAGGRIRIRADHVIEAMAMGLGGRCTALSAPFDPEGGAYAEVTPAGTSHDHHRHDVHDHDH